MECTNAVDDSVSKAAFVFSLGFAKALRIDGEIAVTSGLRITLAMSCGGKHAHSMRTVKDNTHR